MPHLSASSQSHARPDKRTRHALSAAVWLAILSSLACRDTREDTNFCSTCTGAEGAPGIGTDMGAQEGESGSAATTEGGTSSPTGVKTSPGMMSSGQAGAGRTASGVNAAATSGGAGTSSSVTAGARASQAGSAARPGTAANGGSGGDPDASNGGSVPNTPRDAGMSDPGPTDAGNPTPMPCNGACPNSRPVCDESMTPARCVECNADDQLACAGETRTCDLEQNRCVQCTANDARNCDSDTPVCNQENRCVRCTSERPESCPSVQPICIDESRCVECRTNNDCRSGDRNMCNPDNKCVICMNDAQCMDPTHPRCDAETNGCVGCEGDNDCSGRFPQTRFCEKQRRECVACLPNGESQCEAGTFCDPGSYSCTPGRPTLANCAPCASDRDCGQAVSIAACIEHDNGKFCFATLPSTASKCEPGYMRASDPGHPGFEYCLPIVPVTCPAIAAAVSEMMCTDLSQCGKGAQCPTPDNHCRLACASNDQCPAPLRCDDEARVCKKN